MESLRIEKRIELQAPASRVWRPSINSREFGQWSGCSWRVNLSRAGCSKGRSRIRDTSLCGGGPYSILAVDRARSSGQAITKHLRVLERVEIVRCRRVNRFELDPGPIERATEYIDLISKPWDQALGGLKSFVED